MLPAPRDLRQALRSLLRQPGFFLVAVLTLALGIGAVTAVFSVVNGVLLTPLPYADADRIVRINRVQPPYGGPIPRPTLGDWREGTQGVFSAMGAFTGATVNLTGSGAAERLAAYRVTPEFWDVMALGAELGRYFGQDEEHAGERVAVLSHGLWQRRFGGNPEVVGRDIVLNGEPHRVIGVTPASFRYPGATQVYLPTHLPLSAADRGTNYLFVLARLAPGATLDQADAAMARVNAGLAEAYPAEHEGLGARITPLHELLNSDVRQPLVILLAASALVLLIACANLANLLLARGSRRHKELALRAAVGAGRGRLAATVLGEAVVIAAVGGLAGIALAAIAVPLLLASAPDVLPSHGQAGIDLRVLGASLALSVGTVLVFALWPALRAARVTPGDALQEEGRSGSGGRAAGRMRSALVAAEIALSLTLLAGAGLMLESLRQLGRVDPGLSTEGVLTAAVVVPLPERAPDLEWVEAYRQHTQALDGRLDAIIQRVGAIPGVQAVGLSDALPLTGTDNMSSNVEIVGREPPASRAEQPGANWRFVNPDYFEALGIRVVQGRGLVDADRAPGGLPVQVMVNQTFARRFLDGVDPVGQQIAFLGGPKTIVGVVGDVRAYSLDRAPPPEVYLSHVNAVQNEFRLAIKVQGDPMALAEPLRRALQGLDPNMPVFDIRSMDDLASGASALRRFNLRLMGLFGLLALGLAAIGLYGVIAYAVAQRRHEFGIRLSLGADSRRLLGMVMRQGAWLLGMGVAAGLVGALLVGRVLASQLYGVDGAHAGVLVLCVLLLSTVALFACLVPAHRASRIAPAVALRDL